MSRLIEWDGQPLALLVEGEGGDYLVPPVVFDGDGNLIEGQEVLAAVVASGVTVQLPIIEGANPGTVAEIDRRLAHISNVLGVPLGPVEEI